MSNYDIHDQEHSEKVLEIIENLLEDKIKQLTLMELLLLYLSAYMHDSAIRAGIIAYNKQYKINQVMEIEFGVGEESEL